MIDVIQSIAAVVLTFGMVIFLHEAGHFILCLWFGVRVERFAFGFGPELIGMTKGSTRFSVCAFPLGGFVKPAGEELDSYSGREDEYFAQVWYRRLAIVAAGPAMNYVLAFTLFTGVIAVKGLPEPSNEPVIGNLMLGLPADRAGIKLNDRIIAVDGQPVATWEQLASSIHARPEQAVELSVERDGSLSQVTLTPKKDEESGRGVIGIMRMPVYQPVGIFTAAAEGAKQCYALSASTVKSIVAMLGRRQKADLAGPVGIVQMVSRAAHSGWEDLVLLIGFISVAIGFFNILPVPLLDGGHAAMYLWEGLSGRKLTKEAMATANGLGIALLVSLLLFATYSDFHRIRSERARAKSALSQPGN
ncbi:MAG: hypothetical protein A3J74_02400 [Elusimicrobia bacterium RIFCSPHIGHO2_02_FULL_57_9]|nr:MAG: hypothetical protein A3J74_02400 [Elusimicrobia bacterium RIFCSPHIGHO2_02_FULL_57_9]